MRTDHPHALGLVFVAALFGMAPMASRVFLSLDYLSHPKVSLLNGGFMKWQLEKRPVSTEDARVTPGRLTPKPRTVTVDADFVNSHTGQRGFAFIDTRTTPEYLGTGSRSPGLAFSRTDDPLVWRKVGAAAAGPLLL